jgi:peptidoglycan/LPS O-acetylase OafA/YrhL
LTATPPVPRADVVNSSPAIQPHARIAGLDGLRGSAAICVVLCHFAVLLPNRSILAYALSNGWTGVDLFFVISGFLITGILFDAKGSPHYFRNFYVRRTLRIFPLYYGFLVATVAVMLIVPRVPRLAASSGDVQQLWDAQPWLWTYTANYWASIPKANWSKWAESVVHLWSLSVEEQFYLVWPVVVFALSRRNLIRLCVAIPFAALAIRVWFTWRGMDWFVMYTWTPTRADSLAAGALVALLIRVPRGVQRMRRMFNWLGPLAAVLAVPLFWAFDPTKNPWRATLIYTDLAVLFAALLFWSTDTGSLRGVAKRFYELRPLRAIGRYSYGVYVFHLPLLYITTHAAERFAHYDPINKTWRPGLTLLALNLALTAAVSLLSYRACERRFLEMKAFFRNGG